MRRLAALLLRLVLIAGSGFALYGAWRLFLLFPVAGFLLVTRLAWQAYRRRWHRSPGTSHGSARLADAADLLDAGMLDSPHGLPLGTTGYLDPTPKGMAIRILLNPLVRSATANRAYLDSFRRRRSGGGGMIRLPDFVHGAVFAPTGKGKTLFLLVAMLLSHFSSCVVTDPKGELYELTAEYRRRRFHHRVVRIDPFFVCGPGGDSLNPLAFIDDTSPSFLDQCRDLAHAFIIRTGKEHETHFLDAAEEVLTAFIAFVCACAGPGDRHLQTVRDLVSSRSRYEEAMEAMQNTVTHGGVIRRLGFALQWHVDKELASTLATVQRFTNFLDSEAMQAVTLDSTFDPAELRSGRMTVHLVLPPERLASLAPAMRMWMTTLLRVLAKGKASERNPVLFLVDECAHLGQIQALEDAVTVMRGYGVRLLLFFQSVGQLTKCFGDRAGTILDNLDTQVFFGINAYESAEFISKRIGDETIIIESDGDNDAFSWQTGMGTAHRQNGGSRGRNRTFSLHGRPVLRPDEVLRLPGNLALVFHKNLPPIPVKLVPYVDSKQFKHSRRSGRRTMGAVAFLMSVVAVLALWLANAGMLYRLAFGPKEPPQPMVEAIPSYSDPGNPRLNTVVDFSAEPAPPWWPPRFLQRPGGEQTPSPPPWQPPYAWQ